MRVLVTSSWYPSRVHATLGNFVQRHAEAIAHLHEVVVLHFQNDPNITTHQVVAHEVKKIGNGSIREVILYYPHKGRRLHSRPAQLARKGVALLDELQFEPEIVYHSVLYPKGMHAAALAKHFKVPLVSTEHSCKYYPGRRHEMGPLERQVEKRVGKKLDLLLPVTEDLGKQMHECGVLAETHVVPNVVDTELFLPKEKPSSPRFIHISTAADVQKNVSGILRAFKKFCDQNDKGELVILSDGDVSYHKQYSKEICIPKERLSWIGPMPIQQVAQELAGATALVLFSRFENFPCVIAEAFSCGVPVISTDLPGIMEHLTEDKGISVGQEDEHALTAAMETVASNPEKFNSEELRLYALEHFSQMAVANAFTRAFEQAQAQFEKK